MTLQLGSNAEARIQEGIKTGRYKTASDVLLAGLELLEEREKTSAAQRERLRKEIAEGFAQLDRGEGLDGPFNSKIRWLAFSCRKIMPLSAKPFSSCVATLMSYP